MLIDSLSENPTDITALALYEVFKTCGDQLELDAKNSVILSARDNKMLDSYYQDLKKVLQSTCNKSLTIDGQATLRQIMMTRQVNEVHEIDSVQCFNLT